MKLTKDVSRRDVIKAGAISTAGLLIAGASSFAVPKIAIADEQEVVYHALTEENCPELKRANDFARMKYKEAVARSLAEGEEPVEMIQEPVARGETALCSTRYTYHMPGHFSAIALIDFATSYYRAIDEYGVARFGEIYSCYASAGDMRTGVTEEGSSAPVRLDGGRTLAKGFGLYIEAEDYANPFVVWTAHQAFYVEFGAQSNTARVSLP